MGRAKFGAHQGCDATISTLKLLPLPEELIAVVWRTAVIPGILQAMPEGLQA